MVSFKAMLAALLRVLRLSPLVLALGLASCVLTPGQVDHVRYAADARATHAQTSAGVVRGVQGAGARAFLGVPYAAPPTGHRRWRAPEAVEPWSGARDATRLGRGCVQAIGRRAVLAGGGGVVVGSEDCLFANIYAPADATDAPVMVFIHGGAFTLGSGGQYDPSRLAVEQGRVVVTFNYRLGALGWLAYPDLARRGDPGGDFGLMDQTALLRWVQHEIAAFGGDPDDVTVFGESAGGWSLCYLMASPEARGLYHRAIVQSAGCLEASTLTSASDAARDGLRFGEDLGCADAACLRALPIRAIARAASTRRGINGPGSWGPVQNGLRVPRELPTAFSEGAVHRTPVFVGSNRDEARLFTFEVRSQARFEREMRWSYGDAAPAVLELYPVIDGDFRASMAASLTDALFACPSHRMRVALSPHQPVRGYEFADPAPPIRVPRWLAGDLGAYHASELAFVFGTSWPLQSVTAFTAEQAALSARMRRAWAEHDTAWPLAGASDEAVVIFDPQGDRLERDFAQRHNCVFWARTPLGGDTPRLDQTN